MPTTVADQIVERVEALMREGGARTRAQAIRRVAEEMDRSVSATSSAFYAGRRAAAAAEDAGTETPRARRSGRGDASHARLYAEMLPLVEAGGTIEQAARRFGDEDEADEIAAGFTRWLLAERDRAAEADDAGLAEARSRAASLEAEVRGLRLDLARARSGLARVRVIAEEIVGDGAG